MKATIPELNILGCVCSTHELSKEMNDGFHIGPLHCVSMPTLVYKIC